MRSWIALSALALGACTAETSSPATPDHLEVVQAPTVGTPGRVLDSLILVRMVSDQGRPIAGATLSWSIIDGGGTVTPVQATTGEDGIVAAIGVIAPAGRASLGAQKDAWRSFAGAVQSILGEP